MTLLVALILLILAHGVITAAVCCLILYLTGKEMSDIKKYMK